MERNAVTERFLKYSLERNCKICVVLMQAGQMKKVNLRVTAIGEDGFDAVFSEPETARSCSDGGRAHRRLCAWGSGCIGVTERVLWQKRFSGKRFGGSRCGRRRWAAGRCWSAAACATRCLGGESADIDCEVYGLAPEQLHALAAQFGTVDESGARYGIFTLKDAGIDLAVPRLERRDRPEARRF